jgi:hypothetical protein
MTTKDSALDPSKVAITLKGGDYIEAESDGTKIGGWVSRVTEDGFVVVDHLGMFAVHQITASPQNDDYRFWILTAHQPAPKKTPRERVVDILIDYSNNRADDYDTADRIMAALVPFEGRPLPTRAQVFDILYPDGIIPAEDQKNSKIDALRDLFGGESR